MATFTDKVENVVKISVSITADTGGDVVDYTVPTGKRAIAYIQRILTQSGSGLSRVRFNFTNGTSTITSVDTNAGTWTPINGNTGSDIGMIDEAAVGIPMSVGETIDHRITFGGGGQDLEIDIVVLEFAL